MKKLTVLVVVLISYIGHSQITFKGCNAALSNQDYILTQTNTIDDAGTLRNTYESSPADFTQSCNAGVCEVRIIWSITNQRWEIQLDNDGPLTTPDYTTGVLYYNTEASYPNPPDLTLGTWVDNLGGSCGGTGSIITLTGSIQSSILNVEDSKLFMVEIYPNPAKNFIKLTNNSLVNLKKVNINDINGRVLKSKEFSKITIFENIDISNLNSGLYFITLQSNEGFITKKLIIN